MIVIFNNDFLEDIRKHDNSITISSYTLDKIDPVSASGYSAQKLLSLTPDSEEIAGSEVINGLRGIWESDTKKFKVCLEVPEKVIVNPSEVNKELVPAQVHQGLQHR